MGCSLGGAEDGVNFKCFVDEGTLIRPIVTSFPIVYVIPGSPRRREATELCSGRSPHLRRPWRWRGCHGPAARHCAAPSSIWVAK